MAQMYIIFQIKKILIKIIIKKVFKKIKLIHFDANFYICSGL